MLGFGLQILLGAAGAVLGGVVMAGVIYIVICGKITRPKLKEALKKKGISATVIRKVDRCENRMTLQDLKNCERKIEIRGDGMTKDLEEGEIVFA